MRCLLLAIAALSQTVTPGPRFEVATITTATIAPVWTGPGRAPRSRVDSSRYELRGANLQTLIRMAYRLQPYQNVTGPDWMGKRYFDIFAKLPEGADRGQIPEMLQALLAEQLKLVIRRDTPEQPVCILTVGRSGPKIKEIPADVTPEVVSAHTDGRTVVSRTNTSSGSMTYSRLNGTVILDATKITMPELALALRREVNLPVIDRTGLKGFYAVSLYVPGSWIRSAATTGGREDYWEASEPQGVNLFKSIQRIGLKLQKSTAPIDHLIVEHAEQIPVQPDR
jgi:uncharacterized protein (TIGR03435 family)